MLSTERIVSAGRRLFNSVGERFTMSMLAQELGVAPSSLYNHVESKADVLAKISDDVVRAIDLSALRELTAVESHPQRDAAGDARRWRQATEVWARSYVEAFTQEPALVATLAVTPIARAPQTLAMYEQVITAFLHAGWPEQEVLPLVESLEAFLLGSALDAAAPDDIFSPGKHTAAAPQMARAYRHHAATTGPEAARQAFQLGIGAFLDGLEARLRHLLEEQKHHDEQQKHRGR